MHRELRRTTIFTTLLILGTSAVAAAQPAPQPIAIEHVTVLPMDSERRLEDQTVLLRDGRIEAIGRSGDVEVPSGAERVDGRGKFLVPGLADMHVHFRTEPEYFDTYGRLYVTNGVTTVLEMNSAPELLDFRDRIAAGDALAPTIFTMRMAPNGGTYREAYRFSQEARADGYDLIKVYGQVPGAAFRGLAAAARSGDGLAFAGHLNRIDVTWEEQFELGMSAVAHAEEYLYVGLGYSNGDLSQPLEETLDETRISNFANTTARHGTAVIPTLTAFATITDQSADVAEVMSRPHVSYVPSAVQYRTRWLPLELNRYASAFSDPGHPVRLRAALRYQERLVDALDAAGVRILAGTDAPLPGVVPGFTLVDEIVRLHEAGMSRRDALAAATVEPGRYIGRTVDGAAPFGTVTVGARADLLVLDADPLRDLETLRRPTGVVLRGRWLPRTELDAELERVLEENRAREPEPIERMYHAVEGGLSLDSLRALFADPASSPDTEGEARSLLNRLGYGLLGSGRVEDAVEIFRLNVELHPDYANGFDSLGEGLATAGRTEEAIRMYERAIELDPDGGTGRNARRQIERLRARGI